MVDLDRATDVFGFDGEHRLEADQFRERLGPGLVHADFADWAPEQDPPAHPAEALSPSAVQLLDHVGTSYGWTSAETGHPDDPWRVVLRFRPTPPPDATTLLVRVGPGETVELDVPPRDGC